MAVKRLYSADEYEWSFWEHVMAILVRIILIDVKYSVAIPLYVLSVAFQYISSFNFPPCKVEKERICYKNPMMPILWTWKF